MSNDALHFAHPIERRQAAAKARAEGKSLREAGRAAGVAHTVVHYWDRNGLLDGLDTVDPEATLMMPESVDEAGNLTDPLPATSDSEPDVPQGFPQSPEDMDTAFDGTKGFPQATPDGWPQYPDGGFAAYYPGDGTQDWLPDSVPSLQAFFRYCNALVAGGREDAALRSAQVIDPDFSLSDQQRTSLLNSLSTLILSERLHFAATPPDYVRSVYDQYAMNDDDVQSLSGYLAGLMTDGYTAGINGQLSDIGRDGVGTVSDPATLATLQDKADAMAQDIADTHNRDLANAVGSNWIDLSATEGTQMSRYKLDSAISDWMDNRADWKSDQIAQASAMWSYNTAVLDFQDQNGFAQQARLTGDAPECPDCQDAIADLGDWMDVNDFLADDRSSGGLHPYCSHFPEFDNSGVAADADVWAAQSDEDQAAQA